MADTKVDKAFPEISVDEARRSFFRLAGAGAGVALFGTAFKAWSQASGCDVSTSSEVYPNYQAVREINVAVSAPGAIIVLGREHAGDGGGGIYLWNAESVEPESQIEDGVEVFFSGMVLEPKALPDCPPPPSAGRWERKHEGTVLIDWFRQEGLNNPTDWYAIQAAILWVGMRGGGVVAARSAESVYEMGAGHSSIRVQHSNVTIDGQGATIVAKKGAVRFDVDGDPTEAGGDPQTANVWIQNWQLGDDSTTANRFNGIHFNWCRDSGARNILRRGQSRGTFRLKFSQQCVLENIWLFDAAVKDACTSLITFMVFFGQDCVVRNCHVRDALPSIAFQNKGALNTLFENCTVDHLNDSEVCLPPGSGAGNQQPQGFYERGDAPYKPSMTTCITYPFAVTEPSSIDPWQQADVRRESRGTVYRACHFRGKKSWVSNAWEIKESSNCTLEDCTATGGRILVRRTNFWSGGGVDWIDSTERDFVFRNVSVTDAGGSGLHILGANACYAPGATCNHDAPELPGVVVMGGSYQANNQHGILVDVADRPLIRGVTCKNNGQGAGTFSGIHIKRSRQPRLQDCICINDQPTASQTYGIRLEPSCEWPHVVDCQASENASSQFLLQSLIDGGTNRPGSGKGQTTDAMSLDLLKVHGIDFGELTDFTALITATVLGRSGTSASAWKQRGLFNFNAGIPTAVGSPMPLIDTNPAGWGSGALVVAGNSIRIRVRGIVGATIDWSTWLECKLLSQHRNEATMTLACKESCELPQ